MSGTDRPRLSDVAAATGYSLTTVSHAFSGARPVAAATRRRILEAAFQIGFVPERRTGDPSIGMLIRPRETVFGPAHGTSSFAQMAGAILIAALARGMQTTTVTNLDDVAAMPRALDGYVVLHPNTSDDVVEMLENRGVPLIVLDPPRTTAVRYAVHINYSSAVRELVQRFHRANAQRVTLVTGATDNNYSRVVSETFFTEARKLGLTHNIVRVPLDRLLSREFDQRAGHHLAERRPEAVITTSAVLAERMLQMALSRGIGVPDDLQIASVIDGERAARASTSITSFAAETMEVGREVIRLLEGQIRGFPEAEPQVVMPLQLIERNSTRS